MENPQSSYYSDSYGDIAVKIFHDTVHQRVSEQHIDNNSLISILLEL